MPGMAEADKTARMGIERPDCLGDTRPFVIVRRVLEWTGFRYPDGPLLEDGSKELDDPGKGFRTVNLPYMRPGLFQVDFVSNQSTLDLDVYAQDCLVEAFLDGKRIVVGSVLQAMRDV